MNGMRVAVFGLGRSGISAARAVAAQGGMATVYDEKPISAFAGNPALADLEAIGATLVSGFSGQWTPGGTDLIVTSPGVPRMHPKLQAATRFGIPVISEIELAYRIAKAPIVAITGTNGKSTTTAMTYLCLLAAGFSAVLCGNIYGSGFDEIPLVEAAMGAGPDQLLVAEISSFQLEWIDRFRPRAAVITNISDDHLNRYDSFTEYADVKRRIFANMGAGDFAIWHSSDSMVEPPVRIPSLQFGSEGDDAFADHSALHFHGARVPLGELPFAEAYNLRNAQAAVLLAYGATARAASEQKLLEGLRDFRGLAHRMERVGERDGILLVNNSMCTNPEAVVASARGLPRPQILLVGGSDKEMDFSPLRRFLESSEHRVLLYGKDADSINSQLCGNWPVFETLAEAFAAAVSSAQSGQAVVLSPGAASMDQFADFRDRGETFKRMAREWLES